MSLPEHDRRVKAIAAANNYAPRPNGSAFTYGMIAVILAVLVIVIFGMFYSLEVLANPVGLGIFLVPVFLIGVFLRRRRRRLHSEAFSHELSNQNNTPPV